MLTSYLVKRVCFWVPRQYVYARDIQDLKIWLSSTDSGNIGKDRGICLRCAFISLLNQWLPACVSSVQRKSVHYFWYLKKPRHKFTCDNAEHQKHKLLFFFCLELTSTRSAVFIRSRGSVHHWFHFPSLNKDRLWTIWISSLGPQVRSWGHKRNAAWFLLCQGS